MSQPDTHSLSLEAESDESLALMRFFLQNIDLNGDVTSISIRVESTSPFEIPELPTDDTDEGEEDQPEEPMEPEPKPEPEPETPEHIQEDLVRFNEDSDAFTIAEIMYERRDSGFLELSQIQQFTPNDTGINDRRFSQILWDLSNRGLVEKKTHPRDGRKKVYKLTPRGAESVEAGRDR